MTLSCRSVIVLLIIYYILWFSHLRLDVIQVLEEEKEEITTSLPNPDQVDGLDLHVNVNITACVGELSEQFRK